MVVGVCVSFVPRGELQKLTASWGGWSRAGVGAHPGRWGFSISNPHPPAKAPTPSRSAPPPQNWCQGCHILGPPPPDMALDPEGTRWPKGDGSLSPFPDTAEDAELEQQEELGKFFPHGPGSLRSWGWALGWLRAKDRARHGWVLAADSLLWGRAGERGGHPRGGAG